MTTERAIERFDPSKYLAEVWPEWEVHVTNALPFGVTERWRPATRQVWINPSRCGWEWALAHVGAHLDCFHHLDAEHGFTAAQEAQARYLCEIRLDYAFANIAIDGEPTQRTF